MDIPTIDAHGVRLPKLGLGTGLLRNAAGQAAIEQAIALGYRHLDTAEMYTNEATVGAAIAASGVARSDMFVTTKVHQNNLAPDALRRSAERSLAALGGVIDLYLIHWPMPDMDMAATLGAMLTLREEGSVRAIGVSNFNLTLLRQAVEEIGAPVVCNQIEYHALLDQSAMLRYARSHGVAVVCYAPLARGALSEYPALAEIARKHGASPQQIGLKWLLDQDGVAAIPRAGRRETQQQNLDALAIVLDDDDRAVIAALPKDRRLINVAWAPAWD
jgi:2,5-diketo-D-gluconate reductase B